ncbi:MAG: N-acetylmuramic acid 6-phosphate etherase [Saprospiraceae bacterium]
MKKITEQDSKYQNLEKMSTQQLLENINAEDQTVAFAVQKTLLQIEPLVNVIVEKMKNGGRLFYLGAGTSGRLGVLDASECPPTFGVSADWIIGLIAGGDQAIRNAVENAEDDIEMAWKDLEKYEMTEQDVLIGIAASGTTPYVVHGLIDARKNGITTGCITCNLGSPLAVAADFPIEVVVGPEFVTGSSRMKAGTAQKMILNMISTSVMIQLGRVEGNKMVDMQLSNDKLWERGIKMIQNEINISKEDAKALLEKYRSVRKAIEHFEK